MPTVRRFLAKVSPVVLALGVTFTCLDASAQDRLQLGAYAGAMIGGTVTGESPILTRQVSLQDSVSYGGTIDIGVRHGAFAELSYTRQATEAVVSQSDGTSFRHDVVVEYAQIGGTLDYPLAIEWIRPVFGATIGATRHSAEDQGIMYDDWHFSFLVEGGAKFQIIRNLGLRFRARLLTTFLTEQAALLCGGYAGCAYAWSGTPLFQGEFAGGAYLSF